MAGSSFLLQAEGIDKRFPGVHALERVFTEAHRLLDDFGVDISPRQ